MCAEGLAELLFADEVQRFGLRFVIPKPSHFSWRVTYVSVLGM